MFYFNLLMIEWSIILCLGWIFRFIFLFQSYFLFYFKWINSTFFFFISVYPFQCGTCVKVSEENRYLWQTAMGADGWTSYTQRICEYSIEKCCCTHRIYRCRFSQRFVYLPFSIFNELLKRFFLFQLFLRSFFYPLTGSTFPKAKPKQSLLTVLRLAVVRYLLLPLYAKWYLLDFFMIFFSS